MFLFLPIATLLCGSPAEPMNGQNPISAVFSTTSHNRIAVEDGSVEKIFGDGSFFSIHIDPSTGNAFINVLKEIKNTPMPLSLVTGTGLVQDVLVTTQEGVSPPLLLREAETNAPLKIEPSLSSSVIALTQILHSQIPHGYGELSETPPLDVPPPLTIIPLRSIEGPFDVISVYRVINQGTQPITLAPEAFQKHPNQWALLATQTLHAQEESTLLIGQPKEGMSL